MDGDEGGAVVEHTLRTGDCLQSVAVFSEQLRLQFVSLDNRSKDILSIELNWVVIKMFLFSLIWTRFHNFYYHF